MGRGKIEIKRIENATNRMVTFSKRRTGITKKAKEITVLCDAKVSLIIFASNGKMHEYCSHNTSLSDILDIYQNQSGKRLWDAKHENLSNEIDRVKKENDNMQIELRHLRGEDIGALDIPQLMEMEETLEIGLTNVREKMMEIYKMKKRNTKMLEEEISELSYSVHQQEISMGVKARDVVDDGYSQRVRGYNAQMPFTFRVQPIQPNLQDRM
uniref:Uncharacterized protein n=1 Tax=Kalanchoe fedtschenkoi TaxID=63787 RepID=A0A7N0ZVI5_KALFE